jgi:hypothetical protein
MKTELLTHNLKKKISPASKRKTVELCGGGQSRNNATGEE